MVWLRGRFVLVPMAAPQQQVATAGTTDNYIRLQGVGIIYYEDKVNELKKGVRYLSLSSLPQVSACTSAGDIQVVHPAGCSLIYSSRLSGSMQHAHVHLQSHATPHLHVSVDVQ